MPKRKPSGGRPRGEVEVVFVYASPETEDVREVAEALNWFWRLVAHHSLDEQVASNVKAADESH